MSVTELKEPGLHQYPKPDSWSHFYFLVLPEPCEWSCLRSAGYWFVERMITLSAILIVIAEKFHLAIYTDQELVLSASTCRIQDYVEHWTSVTQRSL